MTDEPNLARLCFLLDVVAREGHHLVDTHGRLFAEEFDADWLSRLEHDVVLSERVDAFAARFGRMQDTLGEKLIPELLRCLAERPGAVLDNLSPAYSPSVLLRRRQAPHLEHFTRSRILTGQASTPPVRSVAKCPIYSA